MQPVPTQRPERPLGVAVLSIWNGFSGGIQPIFNAIGAIYSSDRSSSLELGTFLSLGLASAILFTAIGAYRGDDRSRLGMLLLVTFHNSLVALGSLNHLLAGQQRAGGQTLAIGQLAFSLLLIGMNGWYFLRPATIRYYRRPLREEGQSPG